MKSGSLQTGVAPDVTRQLSTPGPDACSGDFYLCEFPKSGITYLSVLLANTLLIANNYRARATFASVRSYITDLCVAEQVVSHRFTDPPIRFYKTHSVFSSRFIHSIYLVRHPVDVMASNLRYAIGRGWWDPASADDFLDHPVLGLAAWKRHVNGWLVDYAFGSDVFFVHLLRYENLVSDPHKSLRELNHNFGWNIADHVFTEAVAASTRERMAEQESTYRRFNPNHHFEFVSKKGSAQNESAASRIRENCLEELQLLGYE